MENSEIAEYLSLIAVYKELAGENVFKVRAFENAARTVLSASESVAVLFREQKLGSLKGIGEGLSQVIGELVEKGKSEEFERLVKSIPPGLPELLTLQGLGPKKIRTLWKELGINTIGELEYACRENRLLTLPGFKEKTQEKILAAIEFHRSHAGLFLYPEALAIAEDISEKLMQSGLFARIEIAGSLRRGKETVKDADILLVPAPRAALPKVKETLLALADRTEGGADEAAVIGQGDTKVSLRVAGLQIDFRLIEEKSFACAFQYFTGSKEHNTQIRGRAKNLGLKVNEYEIAGNNKSRFPETEEAFYSALSLAWIPPELREGDEEIEAAETSRLPSLVTPGDIKGIIHAHSVYSDGIYTIEELISECLTRNYSYLCISDHSASARYAGGLSAERLSDQAKEIALLNDRYAPFRVFHGVESDIRADGSLDYPDEILLRLDFVIGAIHSKLKMEKAEATDRLLGAVNHPRLTILAHPSGRLLLTREGYPYETDTVLKKIAERGVVLEHNCHPSRLDPDWRTLKKAGRMGIPVSVNPDLHGPEGFTHVALGVTMARKAWLEPRQVLNCRTTEEIDEFFKQRKHHAGA